MSERSSIDELLEQLDEEKRNRTIKLRTLLLSRLPHVIEIVDARHKGLSYHYEWKGIQPICNISLNNFGYRLHFFKGHYFPGSKRLLEGKEGKYRHVNITDTALVESEEFEKLVRNAYKAYKQRMARRRRLRAEAILSKRRTAREWAAYRVEKLSKKTHLMPKEAQKLRESKWLLNLS